MTSSQKIDPKLLSILACPACTSRPPLTLSDDQSTLNCSTCGRQYPILSDGIPVLIIDQAVNAADYDSAAEGSRK